LTRLGFTLADEQKGVYIDGHERQDVIDHCTDIFRYEMERPGRLCTQYEEVNGAWVATEPTLDPGEKCHVMYFHDESIFYCYDFKKGLWLGPD
jgi:hypothetical protein